MCIHPSKVIQDMYIHKLRHLRGFLQNESNIMKRKVLIQWATIAKVSYEYIYFRLSSR